MALAQSNSAKQPFLLHIKELRSRLTWISLSVIVGSIIGYILREPILAFLIKPLNQPLFYLSPAGGLDFIVKICLFFGLLVSLPVSMYHIFRFVAPAIPKTTNRFITVTFILSFLLMITGVSLAYYVSLPAALLFLGKFGENNVKSLISTDEYLSFILRYLLGFGLLFQLPLLLVIVNSAYRLSFNSLMRCQRWVILVSFIVAAIITPTPDPFNMAFMALPIIILYQISIATVVVINRRQDKARKRSIAVFKKKA